MTALVVDFDGTLAHLSLDWALLRTQLDVPTIADLWQRGPDAFDHVTVAEVRAARQAVDTPFVAALERVDAFAVLTANDESAVACWLERHPALEARCAVVVGRRALGGPKHEPQRFAAGYHTCVVATAAARGGASVRYAGDAAWERRLAARLGAITVDPATWADHATLVEAAP